MTNPDKNENRDAILAKLDQADAEDANIEKKTRDLLVTVRHQRDLNKAFSETVKVLPNDSPVPDEYWRGLRSALDNHIGQARAMNSQLNAARLYTGSVYGTTAIASGMTSSVTATQTLVVVGPGAPDWYNNEFAPRVTQLNQVMQQGQMREQVERLFKELQLDKDRGEVKSPPVRLQEAYLALNQANSELATATSILVPLRDCIEAISSMLLLRRPMQEESGRLQGQIESIGRQCKRDGIEDEFFTQLGRRAAALNRIYSAFKDKRILREDVLTHFNAGVALIRSFLHAIDPNKLR